MSFPNSTTSYGKRSSGDTPANPYARSAAAWDERIGSARVQATNWRYIAFVSIALALISTIGVVVIGEQPYAEGNGDRANLSLAPEDIDAVKKMKSTGVPVVVIVISGRPLILDPILDQADAILAAWLPGTEGEGVTDVLLGAYKPTGKLSFTWPSQFKYGFGLTY